MGARIPRTRNTQQGSLTKEPPLDLFDRTLMLIRPGMKFSELRSLAAGKTHGAVPALLRKRWLLLDGDRIVYDRFLSLAQTEGPSSPRVRKTMHLLWALRDFRLRGFFLERVADASGKWRVEELTDKASADYFHQWFPAGSSKKIRSNIEQFLLKCGIYRPDTGTIHLEAEDGWVAEAVYAAAAHEESAEVKSAMLADPVGFLFARGWNGLANLARGEAAGMLQVSEEAVELTDDFLTPALTTASPIGQWKARQPSQRGRQKLVRVDAVAVERANKAHQLLEQLAASAAAACGLTPQSSESLDMMLRTDSGVAILEMKSCHAGNIHAQVRRAVAQLLEYRFTYRNELPADVTLAAVVEAEPPAKKRWLIDYLRSLGITLVWKKPGEGKLVTTAPIPSSLTGIVSAASR